MGADELDDLRAAALAGHRGDAARARVLVAGPHPEVRAAALGALARMGDDAVGPAVLAALADPAPAVRRRAAELAAMVTHVGIADLIAVLADPEPLVVEAACWALGEREDPEAVGALVATAGGHDDPLVREAAVAALGAIGDERGLPAVLAATGDKPAVRRRAVLALAPFEGPEVDVALARALQDRDWQVRQAAEDLLG
ncbi:MAG: HEAT repeat domain-containing protein [Acidimicrobiales bacterium]